MGLLEDLQQRQAELTAFLINPSKSTSQEAGFGGKFLRDVQQSAARQELAVLTNQLGFQENLFIARETSIIPENNSLRNIAIIGLIVVGAIVVLR